MKPTTDLKINENVICDTTFLSIIKISGEDASAFLQGQFSNDINLLNESTSQLSSYNSPKGRMYTSFRLFQSGEDFFMLMPSEIAEATIKRLRMFVMRSKVVLEDLSDTWSSIGLSGASIPENIQQFPSDVDAVQHDNNVFYIRLPGIECRVLIIGLKSDIEAVNNKLANQYTATDASHWKRLDIHAGLPNVYATTQEKFVAQMINFPVVNGVSFTKGCYPGQEVVARMHYLGKLKKRMYRITIDGQVTPTPGDNLYFGDNENNQSIGQIVDSQFNEHGTTDALAVIQVSAIEKGNIRLTSTAGPSVKIDELPYAFE